MDFELNVQNHNELDGNEFDFGHDLLLPPEETEQSSGRNSEVDSERASTRVSERVSERVSGRDSERESGRESGRSSELASSRLSRQDSERFSHRRDNSAFIPERLPGGPISLKRNLDLDSIYEIKTAGVGTNVGIIECPKCLTLNRATEIDCRKCGVVFERLREGDTETQAELLALAKSPVLIKQWQALLEDYVEVGAHHAFVADCERAGALAFAAQKYAGILSVAPDEEIAVSMQNQITALASSRFALPVRSMPLLLRLPMLNALVILLSAMAVVMGLEVPPLRSMAWLGAILLAVSLSLRFFALAR